MTSMTTRPAGVTGARPGGSRSAGPACAAQAEAMFPLHESQRLGQYTEGEWAALAVCRWCPVRAACAVAVLDTLDTAPMSHGVAGGMTAAERRQVRAYRRGLDPVRPLVSRLAGACAAAADRLGAVPGGSRSAA